MTRVPRVFTRRCTGPRRSPREYRFAPAVAALVHHGLQVRDCWLAGTMSDHGVAVARGHLVNRLNTLIDHPGRRAVAQRFAQHLSCEGPGLFTFLLDPMIDATNWRAEHALRPAVVTRNVCGGNRSTRGARTQEVLTSVLRTMRQRGLDPSPVFHGLLRSPHPITALAPTLQ